MRKLRVAEKHTEYQLIRADREFTLSRRAWHDGYSTFRKLGVDTYIIVSPSQNILHTCEPEAVCQILRSNAIDKPTEILDILNLFGPTITGATNREARLYRKVTSPFFNENILQKVWSQSVTGGEALLKVLVKVPKHGHTAELRTMLARLSLHVLNSVCFEMDQDCVRELEGRSPVPSGHASSYSHAMHTMLDHVKIVYAVPLYLLSMLRVASMVLGTLIDDSQKYRRSVCIERLAKHTWNYRNT